MDAMIRTRCLGLLAAMVALLAPAASARAEAPAPVSRLDPAWKRLADSNSMFLTKDQQVLLDDLSFAAAAVDVCPGFRIDKDAFRKAFDGFKSNEYMQLPADRKRQLEYRLMMNFGATVALYMAEALLHPSQACKFAESKRGEGPGRYWVTPASTP